MRKSKKMKVFADFHSHSKYSGDGKASMEAMVLEARRLGYTKYGISDHGYRHYGYGVKYKNYPKMREEIDKLNDKYPDIEIYLGVEANILDDKGNIDVDDYILKYVHYVLAGYHFGSMPTSLRSVQNHLCNRLKIQKEKERVYNTNALINALKNNKIMILTHPGDKGGIDIRAVAEVAAQMNTALEINAHHPNLSLRQLMEIKHIDVKFALGSDAHRPEHLKMITNAVERAEMAGIRPDQIVNTIK